MIAATKKMISEHQHFILTSHVDPDGDGLGGILGLGQSLRAAGKKVAFALSGGFQAKYGFLPGASGLTTGLPADFPDNKRTVFVSIDAAGLGRLGFLQSDLDRLNPVILNIDHHTSNEMFGDVNFFDATAAASCQVIWDLIESCSLPMNADVATCLYCGLLTDTGRFRFSNTDSRALLVGSKLLASGADHNLAVRRLFEENPWAKLALEARVLTTIQREGPIAWMCVTQEDIRSAGTDDTEGFVNRLTEISGIEIALLFREDQAELTKVSLRATNSVDVNKIAANFGGGGHTKASGGKLKMGLRPAIDTVLGYCRKEVGLT